MSVRATILALFGVLTVCCARCETPPPIRCAADLYRAIYGNADNRGKRFAFRATVSAPRLNTAAKSFVVEDESGAMIVNVVTASAKALKAGDTINIQGFIDTDSKGYVLAECDRCEIVGHGPPPTPVTIRQGRLDSGEYDCRLVRASGTVVDAFIDEIDPKYIFYILLCDGERLTVATEADPGMDTDITRLIGKRLNAIGICKPRAGGERKQFGHYIRSLPEGIVIRDGDGQDPFNAPEIPDRRIPASERLASFLRRKVRGLVVAVWHGDRMLVRTAKGKLAGISIANGPPPACGETIEAVGFPETDLYQINLTRSLWRRSAPPLPDGTTRAVPVSVQSLLTDDSGRFRYDSSRHGRPIRLTGLIRSLPLAGSGFNRMLVEDGGFMIPIDISACPDRAEKLQIGALVSVEGICILDVESRRPSAPFPHVKELFVVVRGPSDILVLADPPWWTPGRLLAVIGGLFLITCGSLAWNLSLKRLVDRKGRELKSEITAHLESELKSRERTRLAVELHDSIAQNLSGTAMEIGSAIRFADDDTKEMLKHLELASQTLHSCRDELRDCMWDLRSKALEDTDMNGAIRTTLMPYVSNVTLFVRFNVPRRTFSDNTAHAILRIIRELTVNAVRHGRATVIRIAGSLEGRRLLFSVQDDGRGFDPQSHPGVAQGHFGLQGVRERIERFGGEMRIASAAGRGTKVSLSMDVVFPEEEDRNTAL